MTLKEFKDIVKSIPCKEGDNRPISFCGDAFNSDDLIDKLNISWIDCSDGMLIFLDRDEFELVNDHPKVCSYYAANGKEPCCTHDCKGCSWYVN